MRKKILDFGKPPRTVRRNINRIKEIKEESKKAMMLKYDTERYLVVVFPSREEKEKCLERLGLPRDERYVCSEFVEIVKKSEPIQLIGVNGKPLSVSPPEKTGATGGRP